MKKIYYSDGNFYWLTETPKTIIIDWIPHLSGGEELDQNVDYKHLKAKKDNRCNHCLRINDDGTFTIYPNRCGDPMYLEPATIKIMEEEISSCKSWGVSDKYYQDLKNLI